MSANKHFKNPDITHEEFERIKTAFKKEEFRKLFFEYCEELQDPENRKKFEEEITQLEAERGVEVTFLNPEAGFVVKTSGNGEFKCFLNIAKCDRVTAPSSVASVSPVNGEKGLNWSIPHCIPPPRDDFDNKGARCKVFDVIFHPDALHLAQKNANFRRCLIDTACDGVEREYKIRLDRTNLKFPKLKFKGLQRASVLRKLSENQPPEDAEANPLEGAYPPKPEANAKPKNVQSKPYVRDEYCKPKYVIKHRRPVDLSEMTYELDAKVNMTLPKELVIEVELPLLKSTADCTLDVTERMVYLISEKPAKYKLNIDLPYPVNDKEGSAKFDADKRKLVITLPVHVVGKERILKDLYREDSGVESDVRDEVHSSGGDSPITELIQELEAKVTLPEDSKPPQSTIEFKHPTIFLKNSIHYTFPQHFDCNVLDEVIALVLHVRNVEKESIELIKDEKFFHVKFISIGAGYYPIYYAFYFEFPKESEVKIDSIEAEAWDNNVVLSLNLKDFESIDTYYAGLEKTDLKEFKIQEKFLTYTKKHLKSHEDHSQLEVSVERSEDEKSVEIEIKPKVPNGYAYEEEGDDDESKGKHVSVSTSKKHKKKNKKRRSLSESACDDIKQHQKAAAAASKKNVQINKIEENKNKSTNEKNSSNDVGAKNSSDSSPERMNSDDAGGNNIQIPAGRKQRSYSESREHSAPIFKGILKHYSRYARTISDSCSSIDEPSSYSCSIDGGLRFAQSFSDIPEENSPDQGLSESCKKTVRFNEVIKKQVFRLDSSILGQRKKNQKKKNKKRALQRRHSEGDSADYEDNKSPNNHEQYLKQRVGGERKSSKHDSGLDLSTQDKNGNRSQTPRSRIESESSDMDSKNTLMFDMDM